MRVARSAQATDLIASGALPNQDRRSDTCRREEYDREASRGARGVEPRTWQSCCPRHTKPSRKRVRRKRARAAAEEIAAFETRSIRVETKLNLVLSGTVALIVGMITLVIRSFMS